MRFPKTFLAIATAFAVTATAAGAQSKASLSDRIAADGLATTQSHLAALENPTANESFALGGVSFLRAIETSLQSRYRTGAGGSSEIPLLRLPVPPNDDPDPFEPQQIADIFRTALADFAVAETALAQIDGDVSLPIDITAIWFDIDESGTQDPGEDLLTVTGATLGARPLQDGALIVQFDTADVAWLRAYAHLLSGVSEVVLAYDPTEAITTVTEASAIFGPNTIVGSQDWVDQTAIILLALRQEPDANRTRGALAHFEAMVAQNLIFWDRVADETDNNAEWIPNATQTSAFGVTLSQDVANSWQAILREGGAILKGETVLPYWRLDRNDLHVGIAGTGEESVITAKGINLRKMFTDPAPVDLVLWFQGAGALPYFDKGTLANSRNWDQFLRLLGGDAPLYALWLN